MLLQQQAGGGMMAMERSELEKSFIKALKGGKIQVWYQPQVDMRTGRPRGAEALARWKKEDGTYVMPSLFVPEFERAGLMTILDEKVLGIVCRDLRDARREEIPFAPVSINLSRLHAGRLEIAERFKDITEQYGADQKELSFEITETAAKDIGDSDMAQLAGYLHGGGYRIAVDDYGMGCSTLKLLQEISFDILKIDRYFVSRIGDPKADVILASTIRMAKELGMDIVAEGVETEEQICFLLEHRCRYGQGYYYSEPLPKEQYIRWRQIYETAV